MARNRVFRIYVSSAVYEHFLPTIRCAELADLPDVAPRSYLGTEPVGRELDLASPLPAFRVLAWAEPREFASLPPEGLVLPGK